MALRGCMPPRFPWFQPIQLKLAHLPLAILASGVVATGLAGEWVRRSGMERHQRMEANLIEALRLAVNNRLEVNIALLAAVKGLFEASPAVNRQEFARFVATAASAGTLRGIQGVGFSRAIPADELASRERAIQAEGFTDYRVHPEGERSFYSAIEFLEPFDWRNQRAFGFDMYSEPVRRRAMQRAMLTGLPSLSGKVELLQETDHNPQAGSLLYLPIRKNGRLLGWSYSPLRLADLIGSAINSIQNPDLQGARLEVYDGERRDPAQLLFARKGPSTLSHASYQTIAVAGRPWMVGVELRPDLVGSNGIDREFWGTVAGGLAATLAVSLITWQLVRNQLTMRQALALAEQASQERALAGTVFEASSQGIVVTDPDGVILKANHAYSHLCGFTPEQIEGQRTSLLKSGLHDQAFYAELWSTLRATGHWQGDLWNRVGSGELERHHLSINAVHDGDGRTQLYVGMLEDITDRYRAEEAVRYQALHDPLTGLGNRQLLMEQLQRDLAVAARHRQSLGLLYVDLDGFKAVNDCHGHAVGDRVLEQMAERFRAAIRQSDLLARLGGDEFVVLVPQAGGSGELATLAAKLVDAARQPFAELELPIRISASVGIARFPDHGDNPDALLLAADQAMYAAKESSRSNPMEAPIRLASC
jgi:diguanylate cyclase (GGDEF)-like protein/PAS domain S-box-containing protein